MLTKSHEWYRNNVIELPGVDGDKTSPHKSQIDANKAVREAATVVRNEDNGPVMMNHLTKKKQTGNARDRL
jgi:hypothetical protein